MKCTGPFMLTRGSAFVLFSSKFHFSPRFTGVEDLRTIRMCKFVGLLDLFLTFLNVDDCEKQSTTLCARS